MKGLMMKYFVLNPLKDDSYGEASRIALGHYAQSIMQTNKELSDDLVRWLLELHQKGLK